MAASGLGMLVLFLLVKDSLTDDAYITLAYAKNLALHLHWGLIPQEVSNTATSPLNLIVLAALTAATRLGGPDPSCAARAHAPLVRTRAARRAPSLDRTSTLATPRSAIPS